MRALTIPEVADALRVSVPTVRRLIAGGELPAVQVGRQWRVHPDVLDAWLREGGAPAPAVPCADCIDPPAYGAVGACARERAARLTPADRAAAPALIAAFGRAVDELAEGTGDGS